MSQETKQSIREKAAKLFTSRFFLLEVIIVCSFLMWWQGGNGFLVGLGIALITLWSIRWDWSYFGLGESNWKKALLPAIGYTALIFLINDGITEPLVQVFSNQATDLSNFDGMRGNPLNLLIMLIIIWSIAAFGEEFFFRGYLMKRVAVILGNTKTSWFIGMLFSSFIFGVVHAYQGEGGMISTGVVGIILALAFYKNQQNLFVAILTHGILDTVGILLIYFENERFIIDYMIKVYQNILH
jgi:CAAX protease family protein